MTAPEENYVYITVIDPQITPRQDGGLFGGHLSNLRFFKSSKAFLQSLDQTNKLYLLYCFPDFVVICSPIVYSVNDLVRSENLDINRRLKFAKPKNAGTSLMEPGVSHFRIATIFSEFIFILSMIIINSRY